VRPYLKIRYRQQIADAVILGIGGVDMNKLEGAMAPKTHPQTLGEHCNGQFVPDCLQHFGCDKPTLERIACRTCPN